MTSLDPARLLLHFTDSQRTRVWGGMGLMKKINRKGTMEKEAKECEVQCSLKDSGDCKCHEKG